MTEMIKGYSRSKHHLNVEAFAEPLSAEARYWVGFLLADGCITSNKGYPQISLGLESEDAGHVIKFGQFVGTCRESVREFDCVTGFGKTRGVLLQFTGKELIPQLAKYGVVPRKTQTATVPLALEQDPDFWRGLIDGDGTVAVTKRGYNTVALCGTFSIVTGFAEICYIIAGFRPVVSPCRSIYLARLSGATATKLLRWLYYSGAVALERKAIAWRR